MCENLEACFERVFSKTTDEEILKEAIESMKETIIKDAIEKWKSQKAKKN